MEVGIGLFDGDLGLNRGILEDCVGVRGGNLVEGCLYLS
jgi:hypothetical protein